MPVADIWLIPDFPIPPGDFALSVASDAVHRQLIDQFTPLGKILRRIGPAHEKFVLGPVMAIRLGMRGKGLRHETDFDKRLHAKLQVGIEDFVDDRPIVDRMPGGIFGVRVG